MAKIRKADKPAFEEAVSEALLAIRPQLEALRDVLPQAIFLTTCPDHLIDDVRKEVINKIGQELFGGLFPPLAPPEEPAP
ncbi:MAG TPA: hypothetical protein VK988_15385 [Acidimicrobiales bacterium]|nr:hypothetical protein [Acidimicrobiales bacterium]